MAEDLAMVLFRDILKITEYPGYPFTGNLIYDLISFFFVPMVFMILFTYIILGSLFTQQALRLLVGITIFLVVLVNGWFRIFALLAGPYFIILIFVLGAIWFLISHLGLRTGAG